MLRKEIIHNFFFLKSQRLRTSLVILKAIFNLKIALKIFLIIVFFQFHKIKLRLNFFGNTNFNKQICFLSNLSVNFKLIFDASEAPFYSG